MRGRRPRPYQSVKSEERYVFGIFGSARGRVGHRGHFVRQRRTASRRPHLPCARFGPSDYADVIRKAFEIRKTAKLSQPALEVLTIIAYYQPTTRAYIDQVRGVDSSYTVGLLLERGLIEECGRLQVPGRPRLYRTTKKFLRDFHLGSLEEMPEMPGLEADGQLRMTEDGTILDPSAMTEKEGSVPENREH